jgi:heme exporter protein CcmD
MIKHLDFIVAAYAVTFVGVTVMIAAVWLDYRDLLARLARLESRKEGPR